MKRTENKKTELLRRNCSSENHGGICGKERKSVIVKICETGEF